MADRGRNVNRLVIVGSLGMALVLSVAMGFAAGYFLDKWLGTAPWLTLIFLALGVAAGFRTIFREMAREWK